MNINIDLFTIPGIHQKNIRISRFTRLTTEEAVVIRSAIMHCPGKNYATVYVDAKDVTDADLSGINEIIHTGYMLGKTAAKFVFVYRKNSVIEKWVLATGLDKFTDTAIIPADIN